MNDIFQTYTNQELNMNIIIEGDEHSVWAYLTDQQTNEVIMDGFLCSVGTILSSGSEAEHFIDSGIAPPISKQFSNKYTLQTRIKSTNLEVKWTDEHVKVLINDIEFLQMHWSTKLSFSRAVSTSGPYGQPLN